MPIVVGGSSSGTTSGTFSGLIQEIIDTLDDETIEDRIPGYISRAEARFNRLLFPIEDEISTWLTTTANVGYVALPTRFKKLRSLSYEPGTGSVVLPQLSPDDFKARFMDATPGPPEAFAIAADSIWIGPTPDVLYSLPITYVIGFTQLSQTNQTNWLIEAHPDLYFFGALLYAELDGWNDERAGSFDGAVDRIIAEIKFADAQKRRGDKQETVQTDYF